MEKLSGPISDRLEVPEHGVISDRIRENGVPDADPVNVTPGDAMKELSALYAPLTPIQIDLMNVYLLGCVSVYAPEAVIRAARTCRTDNPVYRALAT